jgi:16S rRNA (guanine(966)-N(2))-methyltransferase RsmD
MRIIAGEFRGRVLKSPKGTRTRPTSDRLRETLFNIISPKINSDTRFLDLCAGSGAVGIEAISRGAAHTTFVDQSRKSCALIEENLDRLEIEESKTEVEMNSAVNFFKRSKSKTFDIVFFDPPYESDYTEAMHAIGDEDSRTLSSEGLLIVEHHAKKNLPDEIGSLRRWRVVKQGESCLSFYQRC